MLKTIVKDEITLTMLEMRHAQAMYDFVERNRDFFIEWIPFVSKTHSREDLEKLIQHNLQRYTQGLGLYYVLWDQTTLIGYVLAREIDTEAGWAEIGYMIDERYARRGIVKTCCIRLMNYLFDELEMEKIVICCVDANVASRALAERFGFTLEGTLRNHFVANGAVKNMCYYGLLKTEYERS
jgi:ribosomal-protein-serine acetyltransferase